MTVLRDLPPRLQPGASWSIVAFQIPMYLFWISDWTFQRHLWFEFMCWAKIDQYTAQLWWILSCPTISWLRVRSVSSSSVYKMYFVFFYKSYIIFWHVPFQSDSDVKALYSRPTWHKVCIQPCELHRAVHGVSTFFDFGRCVKLMVVPFWTFSHSNFKNSSIIHSHLLSHSLSCTI